MPVFSDSNQFYDCLQTLFDRVELAQPQAAEALLRSKLAIRFVTEEPAGVVVMDARKRPFQITYGVNSVKPDVDIALNADILHKILLGDLSITKAMGRRALVAKGPIWKTKALADLFYEARRIYPQVLAEKGLDHRL